MREGRDFATLTEGPQADILLGGGFGLVARVRAGEYQETRIRDRTQVVFVAQDEEALTTVAWQDPTTYVHRGDLDVGLAQVAASRLPGNATSAAFHDGELFIGSKFGLFKLPGSEITRVASNEIDGVSQLSSTEGVLWIVGHHDTFRIASGVLGHFPQVV